MLQSPLVWKGPRTGDRVAVTPFASEGPPFMAKEVLARLEEELGEFVEQFVISSNLVLRANGRPRADFRMVAPDPGAAVHFTMWGKAIILQCDRYDTLAKNLTAIDCHLETMRWAIELGVGTPRQLFAGFQVPDPKPWRDVLGFPPAFPATVALIKSRHRMLTPKPKPENEELRGRLDCALDDALKEIGE